MSSHHQKIEQISQLMEEWDYKIDRLEHRIQGLPAELNEEIQEKYQQLKAYRSSLQEKQHTLKEAPAHIVEEIAEYLDDAKDAVKLLFEDIETDITVDGDEYLGT